MRLLALLIAGIASVAMGHPPSSCKQIERYDFASYHYEEGHGAACTTEKDECHYSVIGSDAPDEAEEVSCQPSNEWHNHFVSRIVEKMEACLRKNSYVDDWLNEARTDDTLSDEDRFRLEYSAHLSPWERFNAWDEHELKGNPAARFDDDCVPDKLAKFKPVGARK